jgi:HEAT repeat protein
MRYLLLLAIFLVGASSVGNEEEGVRRVQAHLLIDDPASALQEAVNLAEKYPDSRLAGSVLIEALAAGKREEEALDAWHRLSAKYPDLIVDRHLMEELSWGILKKGLDSTQNGVRLAALIGAYLTHDVRAVAVLQKMMRDSNAIIRSVAVQMSCSYQDAPLKDEIIRLMDEEKVWVVRLEVIKAIGALKMKSLAPKLQAIVQSERATYEERQIAIEALLNIYEYISLPEFQALAASNRAGIRHLACSIAAHFKLQDAKGEILKLIQDTHPDVRIAALNAFGLIYREEASVSEAMEVLKEQLLDPHPAVAITAGWAAMLVQPSFGEPVLEKWLTDSLSENRRLAAAALTATGGRGTDLALKILKTTNDPYVKANLAVGLLGQRVETGLCCDSIYEFLKSEKRMWMWDTRPNPLFQVLAPSQVRYVDHIPNYPEAIDQMTRLNLVSLLAIVEDPRASEALKSFLQKRNWGISGVAAATLLQEGDESALEIVRECLNDNDPNVRLQACLVLAMMGRDASVLSELQGAYAGSDHERKLHILEALGRMGTAESFSFLVGVFREPFPILRVAAAAALIQCINR